MSTRLIIDGNSVYEIDEECERSKRGQDGRRGVARRSGNGIQFQEKNTKRKKK